MAIKHIFFLLISHAKGLGYNRIFTYTSLKKIIF